MNKESILSAKYVPLMTKQDGFNSSLVACRLRNCNLFGSCAGCWSPPQDGLAEQCSSFESAVHFELSSLDCKVVCALQTAMARLWTKQSKNICSACGSPAEQKAHFCRTSIGGCEAQEERRTEPSLQSFPGCPILKCPTARLKPTLRCIDRKSWKRWIIATRKRLVAGSERIHKPLNEQLLRPSL